MRVGGASESISGGASENLAKYTDCILYSEYNSLIYIYI